MLSVPRARRPTRVLLGALRERYGDSSMDATSIGTLRVLWHSVLVRLRRNAHESCRLTWAEFQEALGDGSNAMVIKRLFDILDEDHDGIISRADFVDGLYPLVNPAAKDPARMRMLFDLLDLDGAGALSREALIVYLHLCRSNLSPEQLERIAEATLQEAPRRDIDGRIRLDSFHEMLSTQPAQLLQRLTARLGLEVHSAIAAHMLALPGFGSEVELGGKPPASKASLALTRLRTCWYQCLCPCARGSISSKGARIGDGSELYTILPSLNRVLEQ